MVYCAAYGCTNIQKKGCGWSFFSFPKEPARRKAWIVYCRRERFDPTKNSRLCSEYFSKLQLDRDPEKLKANGYVGALIRLKSDATPDIPLRLPGVQNTPKPQPRGAFLKRQKADKLQVLGIVGQGRDENPDFTPVSALEGTTDTVPTSEAVPDVAQSSGNSVATSPVRTTSIETHTKRCQVSIPVPQRTRRIQVSFPSATVTTVSIGVQCTSLCDEVPLRVAAGLLPFHHQSKQSTQPDQISDEVDDDDSDDEEQSEHQDPDYDPLEESDSDSDNEDDTANNFPLRLNVKPEDERQFLVSESKLAQLLQKCDICGMNCDSHVNVARGTMIGTISTCSNGHCSQWESQNCHQGMSWLNLMVAGAIVFSGSNISKSLRLFQHLKVQMISRSTFNRIQTAYIIPTTIFTWDFQQQELLNLYQEKVITVGGDARCDSPGFSAKYGSYTLMELDSGKILDFQLVQSNEVAGSTHMELEGLKRGLQTLENAGIQVTNLVTDRHSMVKKYMRTEHPEKKHYFDVWHLAKGVSKKLEAASKKKDCQDIKPWMKSAINHCYWVAVSSGDNGEQKQHKWTSIAQHVADKHDACEHKELETERLWLREGSQAHKLFREVVESQFLLQDIAKLSPLHQTYGLEVFHSVVNNFAPKNTHFFYAAMMARLCVATLHFNENGRRLQATTVTGAERWHLSYPKRNKGDVAVVKPDKTPVTYEYVEILRINLVERRLQFPSCPAATAEANRGMGYKPPPLTSSFIRFNKEELITTRRTRFARGKMATPA